MSEFPSINNFDGMNYSPDASGGGGFTPPPPEMGGNPEQLGDLPETAFRVLAGVVVREYLPLAGSGYGGIDLIENQEFFDESKKRTEELIHEWGNYFPGEELQLEVAQGIVESTLGFWKQVGRNPVDGKTQKPRDVAAMLAFFDVGLEKSIKSFDVKYGRQEDLALRVTGELLKFVNDPKNGKNIQGEVSVGEIQEIREKILKKYADQEAKDRRAEEEERIKKEKEEKFNRVVDVIRAGDGSLSEAKNKQRLTDLNKHASKEVLINVGNAHLDDEAKIQRVLGNEAYSLLKNSLNVNNLSEYGDVNYFYGAVEKSYQLSRESVGEKQLQDWLKGTLEGLSHSPEPKETIRNWVEALKDEVDKCFLLGKYTDKMTDILSKFPPDVDLEMLKSHIEGLAVDARVQFKDSGMKRGLLEEDVRLADLLQGESGLQPDNMNALRSLGVEQGRGIEAYLLTGATQEVQRFAATLTSEERAEWEVRLVGRMIDGGRNAGLAQFYLNSLMADVSTGPDVFQYMDYAQFLHQAESGKGYADPKDLQKIVEFRGPEVFEILYRPIHERAEILNEDGTSKEWIDFDFRAIDVMAMIDSQEAWAELRVNEGLGVGSFNYAKGKWIKAALYHSMGVGTREEIKVWMNQQERFDELEAAGKMDEAKAYKDSWQTRPPELGRVGMTSLSDQKCVSGIGGLAGVNWWTVVASVSTGRAFLDDVSYTPLESFERWAMTKVGRGFRSAYSTKYAKFPLSAQPCLDELSLLPPMSDYVLQDSLLKPLLDKTTGGCPDEIKKKRTRILKEIVVVDQPVPDAALRFGEVAVGAGSCDLGDVSRMNDQQIVDAWIQKVDQTMQNVDVLGSTQVVRQWELWEKVAKKYSDTELDQAWGGFDWRPVAKGVMNKAELTKCETSYWDGTQWIATADGLTGKEGFWNFVHYANYKLHNISKMKGTRMDGFWRYRVPVEEDISSIASLVGSYAPAFHGSGQSKSDLNKAADPNVLRTRFPEYVDKQIAAGVQKLVSEMKLGTYTDKRMATQLSVAAFKLYCMENMANNLQQTAFVIDGAQSDTANQSFHATMLTEKQLKARWNIMLNPDQSSGTTRSVDWIFEKVVDELSKRGFGFVETKENRGKSDRAGGRVLLSPNGSYVPEVDTGKKVLDGLERALKDPEADPVKGEIANRIKNNLLEQITMMKKQGIYSPAILKGGANTTPLLVLEKVIDSMSIDNLPSEVENTLREYIAELAPKVSSNVYSGPYIIELKTSDLNRGSSANSSIEIGKFRIIN